MLLPASRECFAPAKLMAKSPGLDLQMQSKSPKTRTPAERLTAGSKSGH